MLFPWQLQVVSELLARQERLPHALLLTSPAGCGLSECGEALAFALLCEQPDHDGQACGRCQACLWMAAGSHPDARRVGLPVGEDGKVGSQIPVDSIRGLSGFLSVAGHRGGRRVVLIDPADAMNGIAANALLKSLEEPGDNVVFLVLSERPELLLPTIRSRCQHVAISAPDLDQAQAWLQGASGCSAEQARALLAAAGGAPLHARDLAEPATAKAHQSALEAIASLPQADLSQVADALQAIEPAVWLPLGQRWLMDLGRVSAGAAPRYFPQHQKRLAQLAARQTSLRQISQAAQDLARQFRQIHHPLNPRLFCEEFVAVLSAALPGGSQHPPSGPSPQMRSR
ncbi:MAG: DNA polymerase III subunit delta' [Burkholderiaceae bacterium]